MNKILTLSFILGLNECNAATGNASDGELMAISVLVLMLIIIGIGYFIDFMKSKIKEYRIRRSSNKSRSYLDQESLNSFIHTEPHLDTLSTF